MELPSPSQICFSLFFTIFNYSLIAAVPSLHRKVWPIAFGNSKVRQLKILMKLSCPHFSSLNPDLENSKFLVFYVENFRADLIWKEVYVWEDRKKKKKKKINTIDLSLWDKVIVKLFHHGSALKTVVPLGYSLQDWKCYLLKGLRWIPAEVILRQRELPAPHPSSSPGWSASNDCLIQETILILPSSTQVQ